MASNRPAVRRGATPVQVSTQTKSTVSVEEWEARAPLGELETRSVNLIKAASERVPLPLKVSTSTQHFSFSSEGAGPSRPSTPIQRNKIAPVSRPGTPQISSTPTRTVAPATHPLHPKQPVQTPQQFYDWFALIDRSVAHSQEAHFRAHVANVSEHLDTCDQIINRIDEVEKEVAGMLEGWRSVEEGGKSLKDACEVLLEERDKLLELTDEIDTRLEYFQELEHATRMLNHPGESLVLQTDFLYMVERVDVCIDYLKAHRHFREAEIYLFRFQQCMTRAMTLIKMYFVGSLRALSLDVLKRLSEKDVSPTAQMHLLYTRFKSVSNQLAPLLGELDRRAEAYPQELSALLSECHTAYFAARKSLLVGRLTEEIKGLDPSRTELVELTRAGCSYLKQLCTDEFDLYRHFFNSGEEQLYQYLENLCDYLYDDLRPRILHEPRLTALCEVCTVLQALMVLDVPLSDETSDEDADELTVDLDQPKKNQKGLGRLHISHLLQMVLQDAQTRLFFKAQSVIQAEIRYYVPKQEDLAYPEILVDARKPTPGTEIREKESVSQIFHLPSLDKQDTWFPTLRKTVWVLSQLHDFVKPAIFEDIAQEALDLCRQSFVTSAEMLKLRNPPTSTLDANLFLARHLLILKEIAQNLSLVQRDVEPRIDFGGVTDTLATMLSKTASLLPDALFATLGVPRAEENIKEAKQGIDHELRRACEEVISFCANPICEPLRTWTDRVYAHESKHNARAGGSMNVGVSASVYNENEVLPLVSQEWSQQAVAEDLDRKFREACEGELQANVTRLRLYLEDNRTVGVLVDHVQDRLMDEYGAFRDLVSNMYAGVLREVVLTPSELRAVLMRACGERTQGK
ncbi:Sec34-like family-domain-containing protein [Collybia nuda]|uniref:Conserved oligomeric Golgi complex subunit 3 n=1 Tax=Collybia nuda TaxID=64659 RepID=A0A9P5YDK0_9AGAR|nr:Sec34-like family-domain-containing protein [Collybia nuda]